MVCVPFQVVCVNSFNSWTSRNYKYLRKGQIYTVIEETLSSRRNPVFVIKTPRGATHYRASCFKRLDFLQYDPKQQGDTEDDI